MSETTDIWRSVRASLEALVADGVDRVGPKPSRAEVAALAAQRTGEPVTARPETSAPAARPRSAEPERAALRATPPASGAKQPARRGWQPIVPPLEAIELDAIGTRKAVDLDAVREFLGECTRCPLCEKRKSIVFGEGNPGARVVFVGEGPGADEDRSGRPFVGRAGELLSRMITAVGWRREDVFICNIVKCRPPGNRDPQPEEVAACSEFLDRQLTAIQPGAIVTLGKPAISALLGRPVPITKLRGQWVEYRGIPLMPTFHPAYLLRNYTRETRQAVWDDLRAVRARIDGDAGEA